MSNRAWINFREILKQQVMSSPMELSTAATSGKACIGQRCFTFKFSEPKGVPLLEITFVNCYPNPTYRLRCVGESWVMDGGDPVDDMSSEELAHHCVAFLDSM